MSVTTSMIILLFISTLGLFFASVRYFVRTSIVYDNLSYRRWKKLNKKYGKVEA